MRRLSPFRRLRLAWLGFTDPKIPLRRKILVGLLALAYLVVPIDLVPEALLPVIGYVDDLIIVPLLLSLVASVRTRREKDTPVPTQDRHPPAKPGAIPSP